MKKRAWCLAVPVSVMLLAAWSFAPNPPQPFTISLFGFLEGPNVADGTWSSTGSIDDVGGFTMTFDVSPGQGFILHSTFVLTGEQGTITLHSTLREKPASPSGVSITGPLQITGGTGAYVGINGHGGRGFLAGRRHADWNDVGDQGAVTAAHAAS
jgi:hypothetical protein